MLSMLLAEREILRINTEKTKIVISVNTNINIYSKPIEQVDKLKYLRWSITKKLNPETEICCRIENARSAFLRKKELL